MLWNGYIPRIANFDQNNCVQQKSKVQVQKYSYGVMGSFWKIWKTHWEVQWRSSVEEYWFCCVAGVLLWISQKKVTSSYYEEHLWTAYSSKFHNYILSNTDWFIWKCNDTNRKSLLRQRVGSKRFVIAFIFLLYFFSSLQCFWTDSQKLILTCVI